MTSATMVNTAGHAMVLLTDADLNILIMIIITRWVTVGGRN